MSRRLAPLVLLFAGCLDPDGYPPVTSTSSSSSGMSEQGSSTSGESSSSPGEGSGSSSTSAGSDSAAMTSTSTAASSSGATTDEAMTAGDSTGAAPVCGDGEVNAPGEECDDGDADAEDGCDNACARDRIVFATSLKFSPDWITGLKPADDLCKQLANKAGLDNPFSFSAWLSDSTADAIDRIYPGKGRYLRPDGVVVAVGVQQFTSGALLAPIQADEYGEPLEFEYVWTGTRPDGTRVPEAGHCSDWTSKNLLEKGHIGDVASKDGRWTFIPLPEVNPFPCIGDLHLYCFEGK